MPQLPGLDDVRLSHRTYEVDRGTEHNRNDSEDYLLVLPASWGRLRLCRGPRVVHDGAVRPGMVRVVEPGEHSTMGAQAPFDALVLHTPSTTLRAAADELGTPVPALGTPPVLAARPDVAHLVRSLASARTARGRHRDLLLQSLATALLVLVLDDRAPRAVRTPGLDDARWAAAVAFAEASLARGLDVATWAAAVGLPAPEFARRFRARAGCAPYAWFLDRRVDEAGRLLLRTDAGLADVALAAGFTSQSHFTDAFRHRVGTTPGRWRADHRTGDRPA